MVRCRQCPEQNLCRKEQLNMANRMKLPEKTNVMRVLETKRINYVCHTYEADPSLTGVQIAGILGENAEHVFKTLVTKGKSSRYYVFVIPVGSELDLKKAAKASGEKSVEMIPQKELLPLTGYVHGGCSPIGMKKPFPTMIHETADGMERIFVSAGKVGMQIEVNAEELRGVVSGVYADLTV